MKNDTLHGVCIDESMKAQRTECQRRTEFDANSFHQVGASNVYVNVHNRKLQRVTVHGNITYRELIED